MFHCLGVIKEPTSSVRWEQKWSTECCCSIYPSCKGGRVHLASIRFVEGRRSLSFFLRSRKERIHSPCSSIFPSAASQVTSLFRLIGSFVFSLIFVRVLLQFCHFVSGCRWVCINDGLGNVFQSGQIQGVEPPMTW